MKQEGNLIRTPEVLTSGVLSAIITSHRRLVAQFLTTVNRHKLVHDDEFHCPGNSKSETIPGTPIDQIG